MAAKHTASVDNLLNTCTTTSSSAETVCAGDPSTSEESSKLGPWLKMNRKKAVEVVVLSGVILLVCGLFTIPTILYALPPLQTNEEASINTSHLCTDDLGNADDFTLCQNTSVQQTNSELTCVVGFYLDNSTRPVCIPHCKSWLNVKTSDIVISICQSLSIVTCIVLFIIVRFQRQTIFVFPTFYLVYVCSATCFGAPFLIIGTLLKDKVFCSSDSFIESMMNSSPFCTISGIVNSYVVAQVTLLVTFHALGLCWGVTFPFHYRRFKILGRIKYIHALSVILGLILSAIPALLHLIYGYSFAIGPISACVVRDTGVSYFTLALPISILLAMASSSLVILFWKLFKEFILKRFHLQGTNDQVTKAEIKIFVIMCYYVVMGTFTLSTYTYSLATDGDLVKTLQLYFTCQSIGIQPDVDCGDAPDIGLQEFSVVATVSFVLQGLLPLVIFTFIVNCSCCSKKHPKNLSKSKNYATAEQCISVS